MRRKLAILWDYYQHYHLARLRTLRDRAAANGWDVVAFAAGKRGARADFHAEAADAPGNAIRELGGTDGDLHSAAVAARLRDELDREQPAAVIFPGYGFRVSRAAIRWCRQHRRGAVMMFESQESDATRSWFRELVKRHYVRQADCAFCGGESHARYAQKLGMPSSRVFRKYSVVDNGFWAASADTARATAPRESPPTFIAVGRFVPKKNFHGLLEAFARFKAEDRGGWRLVLIGDGPEREALARFVASAKLSGSVEFPGYADAGVVARRMGEADIFVMPSLRGEQWGLVVNEAMAAGLAPIVSDACGCSVDLIVHEKTGLRVRAGDGDDLLSAMRRLTHDRALRAAVTTAARTHIAEYSLDAFAREAMNACQCAADIARSR